MELVLRHRRRQPWVSQHDRPNLARPRAHRRSLTIARTRRTPSASDADPSLHKDEDCPRRKEKGAAFVYGGAGAPAAATVAADNSALRNLFSD